MFCTACATFNPLDASHCVSCGVRLRTAANPRGSGRSPRVARTVNRLLLLIPVVALLVAGGAAAAGYRSDRESAAAAYRRAEAAVASGDYAAAIAEYAVAGEYRDAPARRQKLIAQSDPLLEIYQTGADALAQGDFETAIASFEAITAEVPIYQDAPELLRQALDLRENAQLVALSDAEERGDWLAAERLLALLIAADPVNNELRARAVEIARNCSPIVLTLNGVLYTVDPISGDQTVISDSVNALWPSWSPDRSKIAFFSPIDARIANFALMVLDVAGGDPRQLATDAIPDKPPVWSPDSTRIAFLSAAEFEVDGLSGTSSIRVVDLATGAETDVTGGEFHEVASPSWSPEGGRIAFVSRRIYNRGAALGRRVQGTLVVADLRTGAFNEVAAREVPYAAAVTWSPVDDQLLVLTSELGSAFYATMITTIRLIDLDSGEVTPVTDRSMTVAEPIWSPDGTRFAFIQGSNLLHVRSIAGAGDAIIELKRTVSPYLSWSTDSGMILAPSITPDLPSIVAPADGEGSPRDLPLDFDFVSSAAGPPQWSSSHPYTPPD